MSEPGRQTIETDTVEVVYEQNVDTLYRYFYFKTLSSQVAEDLTAETFLTFVQKIQEGEQVEHVRSYLYGIARNLFQRFLQKKYRIRTVELADTHGAVGQFVEMCESTPLEERLQEYLPHIPEKQRRVLSLRLIEKKSLSEIAHLMNKNINYVKTTQKRALKSIRKAIACTPVQTSK